MVPVLVNLPITLQHNDRSVNYQVRMKNLHVFITSPVQLDEDLSHQNFSVVFSGSGWRT